MIRRFLDRLVVAWCRLSGTHFIEPFMVEIGGNFGSYGADRLIETGHSGCEACTWCVECGRLLGREEVPI